jgi:hypothetical protein
VAAAVLVGGFVVTQRPASLTLAETDSFSRDLMQLPTIVHDSPAGVAQWRRRCGAALHPPSPNQRQAVTHIVDLVSSRPGHRLVVDGGQSPPTVRTVVLRKADDIAECRRHVSTIPFAWVGVERRLRTAASGG